MISIFVATSGRPEMFRNMLKSLRETTKDYEIEIVAVIDADVKSYLWAAEYEVDVADYSPERRGALKAWNRAFQLSKGQLLVPAGDDQLFHEGWLYWAVDSHWNQLGGYGVLGMNDLAYNGNTQVATMWLFDKKWCKDHMGGVFAPPPYRYYCVDLEWWEKARALGHYFWEERAKVEHLHSAHGKRPVDELDLGKQDWMEEDNRTFEQRKAQGFPVTWEPLI